MDAFQRQKYIREFSAQLRHYADAIDAENEKPMLPVAYTDKELATWIPDMAMILSQLPIMLLLKLGMAEIIHVTRKGDTDEHN